jgi:histone acetyltransferase (RNA polymerase elongator complex component)
MNKGGPKKAAYDKAYNARPDQVKKRMARNQARAEMMKAGKVSKGDGKDVDHKRMLDAGGTNDKGNLRVVSETENRGWRKDHGKQYGK